MGQFILNIGLARDGAADLEASHVTERTAQVLKGFGKLFEVLEHKSHTEQTVVAVFHTEQRQLSAEQTLAHVFAFRGAIHQLAVEFGQDCIALYLPKSKTGRLIGPLAAKWGAFNPAYFLLPNGSYASEELAAAA